MSDEWMDIPTDTESDKAFREYQREENYTKNVSAILKMLESKPQPEVPRTEAKATIDAGELERLFGEGRSK